MSTWTLLPVSVLVARDGIAEHVLSYWGLGEPRRRRRRGRENSTIRNSRSWSSVDASEDGGKRSYEDFHGSGDDDDSNYGKWTVHVFMLILILNLLTERGECGLFAVPNDVGDTWFHEYMPSSNRDHLFVITKVTLLERIITVAVVASTAVPSTVIGGEDKTTLSSRSS